MADYRKTFARFTGAAATAAFFTLPALAFQGVGGPVGGQPTGGGTFSAPEIEIALVSSALLVVGGAALILRDRKARRKLDDDAK
jgi:hypothetical protein